MITEELLVNKELITKNQYDTLQTKKSKKLKKGSFISISKSSDVQS